MGPQGISAGVANCKDPLEIQHGYVHMANICLEVL
jgi:hypothetical protein